ncbi:DUF3500 domain-containing protein [Xanthobacter sp. AM11]|uniref:DUF3500 domain-containing protein n=1 Tax=Xanthobacter sp. AM11 TaxID=3380643 RepID=UPI0039BF36F1
MSGHDFRTFIDPTAVPRFTKEACRLTLFDYPPMLERLLGMWGPLSREPFSGITTDGRIIEGLSSLAPSAAPVQRAAQAASAWLASLSPPMRKRACFAVDADAWRHWQNTPLVLRDPQLELEELDPHQRRLALDVVAATLSARGYELTQEVMANNAFLGELLNMTDVMNEWSFTLSIFGAPSTCEPWGWQLFGHHLALNCLFVGEKMVLSPVFMGAEPDHDNNGLRRRIFEPHERAALGMMRSLSEPERERATLYKSMLTDDQPPGRYHPDDGRQVGGAFQDNRIVPYEGVPLAALGVQQRRQLLDLAALFIETMPAEAAVARMAEIESHLHATHFAWIGEADDVNPFYFRIHSPVVMIEFDHHSGIFLANKDPARFHVHTIVRTPNGGDYGADLLKLHYTRGGHGHTHADGNAHTHTHEK